MLRLAIRVTSGDAEVVLAELLQYAPDGMEQIDGDGWTEYAIYGAPGELPSLPDLETVIAGVRVEVSTSEVEDGWEERWREFHRPFIFGTKLRVRPPWEPAGDEEHDLVVDPGRAFGTGAHPTTSLCLELLLDEVPNGSLFDLGCGSGVIAILAAKLGFEPVIAADYDQLAVDATVINAEVNGVNVDASKLDLRADPLPETDFLVANILAPVLIDLAGKMAGWRPNKAMLSGLLDEQADTVVEAWRLLGYFEERRVSKDGWCALVLSR
jgi:ribosomal protein L11 methyltransferase